MTTQELSILSTSFNTTAATMQAIDTNDALITTLERIADLSDPCGWLNPIERVDIIAEALIYYSVQQPDYRELIATALRSLIQTNEALIKANDLFYILNCALTDYGKKQQEATKKQVGN